ncbi:TPR repeat-containing protein YsoA [Paraliobacillus quinghaiensis]|uniref:TPR repeat-containing protein YsoA n=1 Tax=Paraliobacillus quinghaiensis TaxID=470815 RepID=A0A917TL26_9BACI|nr:DUF3196 family protein [Paraliobacillus quinghaiensis]GGM27120.1 TPR repeat-containing protein YsoA [Paraliobacillus quinghaiensis]
MNHNEQKIVLFPKWREDMEKEAYRALREKRFHDALEDFDTLLSYEIDKQEIAVGKLTCLIELGLQDQAESMCEKLLAKRDDQYYSYVHIYATLLFQANKYQEVSELLEEVFQYNTIPDPFHAQLDTLYQVNEKLRTEQQEKQALSTLKELQEAVKQNDTVVQWHLVNHLHQIDLSAYLTLFQDMLMDETVHPVIKTSILGLLQADSIDKEMTIKKFSKTMVINPSTYPFIMDHPFRNNLRKKLEELEQQNPSLFELADQLLYRYLYVTYPFIPDNSNVHLMKQALYELVHASFVDENQQGNRNKDEDKDVKFYIEEIIYCEKIYFSIMDE